MSNLYDYLLRDGRNPEHVVLTTHTGEGWSRARIEQLTARIAGVLSESGVELGDRVAAQVEKSPQAICLYLACLKLGAVRVPLNTAYSGRGRPHHQ